MARDRVLKYASLLISSFYTINTLSVIFPFSIHHDSLCNLYSSSLGKGGYAGGLIAGFYALNDLLINTCNVKILFLARLYPTFSWLLYVLSLIFFYRSIANSLPQTGSEIAFLYYMLILTPTIWLRLNAAPQTLGFLLSIYILALLARTIRRYSFIKVLFLSLSYLALSLSHPLTPLLLMPGIFSIVVLMYPWGGLLRAFKKALKVVILFLLPYLAILIFKSEYFYGYFSLALSSAGRQALGGSLARTSSHLLRIPYVTWMGPKIEAKYLYINEIYVFCIGLLLLYSLILLLIYNRRGSLALLIWISILSSIAVVFFINPFLSKFLSRPLLFLSLPLGLTFSSAFGSLFKGGKKSMICIMLTACIGSVSLLGLYRAYYYYGAFDIPTYSQIMAHKWLVAHIRRGIISVDALIPVVNYGSIKGDCVMIKVAGRVPSIKKLLSANYFLITQQMVTYTSFKASTIYSLLGKVERGSIYVRSRVYTNGYAKVYETWRS